MYEFWNTNKKITALLNTVTNVKISNSTTSALPMTVAPMFSSRPNTGAWVVSRILGGIPFPT